MEAYIIDVLHLMLRYFHVVAAIAWIGASFYFAWLDNNLETPPEWKKEKGIKGDLWAIHGGGFYEVAKYQNGPPIMPKNLHWFKWEAYTTWLTGFLLFSLIYYVGADAYLIDTSKAELTRIEAIGLSFVLLIAGWLVYEVITRSPFATKGLLFAALCIVILVGYFYGLNQLFSQKAAFLQTGALIGTCMAANVFFHIMPAQRYLVREIEAGRIPDSKPGLNAKNRSVHNNYATLPILFIMLSNHFSFVTGREHAWAILAAILIIAMWIRHYFNLKHQGNNQPMVLVSGISAFILLMAAMAPWPLYDDMPVNAVNSQGDVVQQPVISDAQGMKIIEAHCQSCHSAKPTSQLFSAAPLGFMLDNLDAVKQQHAKIVQRTVINKDMPLGNMSKMTDEERKQLHLWLKDFQ